MISQLLTTETKITEINLEEDTFILTDKRLLYNNTFIGLGELRGVEVSRVTTTQNAANSADDKSIRTWCVLILTIVFSIIMWPMMHPYKATEYFAILFWAVVGGLIFGYVVAIPVYLVIKGVGAATQVSKENAVLEIKTKSNTSFATRYYDIALMGVVQQLSNDINAQIFG